MNLTITETDRQILVTIWSIPGWGRKTYRRIQTSLQAQQLTLQEWWAERAATDVVNLKPSQLESLKAWRKQMSVADYANLLALKNISVVLETDPEYPQLLNSVEDRPPILFAKGNLSLLNQTVISVVGTRNITNYGQTVTSKITKELVANGMTITSGFMYGVDACAHQTSLITGGHTVGVLGFGFDHLYPSHFATFFQEMLAAHQTFITAYAPFVSPNKGTFPQRNRILAGMSLGVVVTEAASKSGSQITAEAAVEYGRGVYAVPGPITNPYTEGTKALINLGALCISSGEEILADLKVSSVIKKSSSFESPRLDPALQPLYQLLTHKSQSLTELVTLTHQPATQILANLAQLELQKVVTRSHGQWLVSSS